MTIQTPDVPVKSLLGNYLRFRNGRTSPERLDDEGYPVFGSNGPIGRSPRTNADGPLVVIGRVGSYCGSLFYSHDAAWVTDNAIICTAASPTETRYWYYALQTLSLNNRSGGSGQPLLNQSVLASVEFQPAAPSKRIAIGGVLGALDDKIAANTRLIEAADELSRVVFTRMLNDTTNRPLSDVADFVNGKAFTKDASGTGRVVIRIAELNAGLGGSTVYNDIDVPDQHLARPGDLLFAWSGSLALHRWFRAEGIINQHIFKVLPKDGYPTWCVSALLVRKLDEFKAIAADKATTMGHIQRRHLDEPVQVPVAAQIERNDTLMTSLWQRALAAEEESLGLVAIRDALLPRLMSGKIRVADAEQMVGDVV